MFGYVRICSDMFAYVRLFGKNIPRLSGQIRREKESGTGTVPDSQAGSVFARGYDGTGAHATLLIADSAAVVTLAVNSMDPNTTNGLAGAGVALPPAPLIQLPDWMNYPVIQVALVVIVALTIYYLLLQLGRHLKRKHGVRLGVLYHLFAFGFGIFLPAVLLRPDWPMLPHIGAVTVIFGAVFIISLVDRYVWELYFKQLLNIDVPKFLPEVARLGILLLGIFIALDDFYGQTIRGLGLLVGPGIAALVIGFAMQDSLGNIISGIALQAGKPYSHGDWLQVDGRYAGR